MFKSEIDQTARKIAESLTLRDKAKLLSQIVWETTDVHEFHEKLDKFLLADGPAGIRRLKEYFDEDIYNTRPSTCYPSPSTYACSWNRKLLFQLGMHMGKEAQQEGVDTMLAPAVNIKRSPLGGRNFEYYSEDPFLTGELAAEFIKGIQKEGVGACLKHFAVNNQETRRMNICAEIDEETLHEVYLAAFEKPVKEGKPKMVMAAYNQVNGEHCASNGVLLDILRNEWGYQGVVVTDCYAAHDLEKGIRHGLTLQMPGEDGERIADRIDELVKDGRFTEEELDAAVIRNISFALDAACCRKTNFQYDREAHHGFARVLAEESMVLLKNAGDVLPLKHGERILVTGELAVQARFQGGGSSHVNPWKLEIPLEEMKKLGTCVEFLQGYRQEGNSQENDGLRQEVLSAAENFDKVVVFAGIPDLVESEGYDRHSLEIPEEQNLLISRLAEKKVPVVVVLANGSVIEMPWKNEVPAILECYLGGEAGASAAARILFGEVNPSGKLAETFPHRLEDNPSYLYFPGDTKRVVYGEGRFVGYKHYDAVGKETAFPFGHGLSYTCYEYRKSLEHELIELQTGMDKTCLSYESMKVPSALVWLKVKNTGSREGKETIQVYVQKKAETEGISPKKLVGFEKVSLAADEEKEVCIYLDEKAFQRYNIENHKWEKENGSFEVSIGSSVLDIRLKETVEIRDCFCEVCADSTIGDLIQIEGMYERLEEAFAKHPVSLGFLKMTKEEDPLKAISMGSLMTFETLKRTDKTLTDNDIREIINRLNRIQKAERFIPELFYKKEKPYVCRSCLADGLVSGERNQESEGYGKGDTIVFDFGHNHPAYFSFRCRSVGSPQDAPALLHIKFCEIEKEIQEDLSDYNGWISRGWLQQEWIYIDETPKMIEMKRRYSFRYAVVTVVDTSQKFQITLEEVQRYTVSSVKDEIDCFEKRGDELLDRIQEVSVRTLSNCMQTVFEDGPKRDRRLWMGDLMLQALVNYETFRNNKLVKRCLYLFAGLPGQDGMLPASVFEKPQPHGDDGFLLDYSLFYLPILTEYYRQTKDRETLEELAPTALKQMELAMKYVDEAGVICEEGVESPLGKYCSFIDWSEGLDKQCAMQGILIYALQYAREICGLLHDRRAEEQYEELEVRLKKGARKKFWDKEQGVFVSGTKKQVSMASQVWMILSGVIDGKDASELLERTKAFSVTMVTPYMHHFYVMSLILSGDKKKALEHIKDYWGGMIQAGADTFWELYNPENEKESPYGSDCINSYCHAWSCTPVYLLRLIEEDSFI